MMSFTNYSLSFCLRDSLLHFAPSAPVSRDSPESYPFTVLEPVSVTPSVNETIFSCKLHLAV